MNLTTCLLRLGIAAALGMLVGVERDLQGRAAGIRTHLLVCVGAALFTMVSVLIGYSVQNGQHVGDPARIAAQIVTGIGFLGAGTILKSGFTVRGLTTAAYLWLVAAIGVACAIGQIPLAILAAIGTDGLVVAIKWAERFMPRKFHMKVVVTTDSFAMLENIENAIRGLENIAITTISREAERIMRAAGTGIAAQLFKSKIEISVNTVKKKMPLGRDRFWQKYLITQEAMVKVISEKLHAMQPGPLSFAILNGK